MSKTCRIAFMNIMFQVLQKDEVLLFEDAIDDLIPCSTEPTPPIRSAFADSSQALSTHPEFKLGQRQQLGRAEQPEGCSALHSSASEPNPSHETSLPMGAEMVPCCISSSLPHAGSKNSLYTISHIGVTFIALKTVKLSITSAMKKLWDTAEETTP